MTAGLGVMLAENTPETAAQLYLDLMKKCLTRFIFPEICRPVKSRPPIRLNPFAWTLYPLVTPVLAKLDLELFHYVPFDQAARADGREWPPEADTMIGLKRLENLQYCVTEVIRKNVPGDFIETGVWRGGASIFMRALLKVYGDQTRLVWVADSFEGLPKPDGRYQQDEGDRFWEINHTLAVSVEQVQANFARYGLLDKQVRFLVGLKIRCQQHLSTSSRCSVWMGICTPRRWMLCRVCTIGFHLGGT
jgi:O-methyltransferase